MANIRLAFLVAGLLLLSMGLSACGKTGKAFDAYKGHGGKASEMRIAYYEIYQPDINYPTDDVIIWQAPDRAQRAFLLAPKTRVEVVKTVDGDKYGSPHVMYQIKTADGRTGWVPKPWCKQVYK
jgi:hypothetical protein